MVHILFFKKIEIEMIIFSSKKKKLGADLSARTADGKTPLQMLPSTPENKKFVKGIFLISSIFCLFNNFFKQIKNKIK